MKNAIPMQLEHIGRCCDVRRGDKVGLTIRGRQVYRVLKWDRLLTYVFCVGRHVIDIRDAAHLHSPAMLEHLGPYTGDIARVVYVAILTASAPHLRFRRAPAFEQGARE